MGERLHKKLDEIADEHRLIKEVRGKGLMIGAEFYEPKLAKGFSMEYLAGMVSGILLQEYGVITAYTMNNPNVIRFEPPLTVGEREVDYVAESLENVCKRQKGLLGVTLDIGKRMLKKRMGFGE
jgi:putrescine aminotransferase